MAPVATASKSSSLRELGAERSVRVTEYHCPLEKGAPVAVEQFSQTTISIVRSGVFGFRSDRDDQLLSTGFVLLANQGQSYEISHDHGGGDRCLTFRLQDAVLEDIAGRDPRSTGKRYFARSVLPPIPRVDALRLLAEQHLASGGAGLGLEELGLALAACVLEHTTSPPRRTPPVTRRTRDAIFTALDQLERNASEECSLSGLAAVVGLSPYHFLRLFKREIGVTPYRFPTPRARSSRPRFAPVLTTSTSPPSSPPHSRRSSASPPTRRPRASPSSPRWRSTAAWQTCWPPLPWKG